MASAKQKQKSQVPAEVKKPAGGVPAAIAGRVQADAGKGVSSKQEDNLVPLIYILQKGSPQVNERDDAYIDGAKAGSIWLRNMPEPLVDGEQGVLFQPCFFTKDWVEWVPRDDGGGFVARHDALPEDAEKVSDPKNPNRVRHVRKNGNEVIETRYHMGLVHGLGPVPLPFVIPLSSTGHTFSRQLMFLMNQKRVEGGVAPSFAGLYRLTTEWRQNKAGDWFNFKAEDAGWVETVEHYELGAALHEAFASGEKKAEAPVAEAGDDDGAADRAGI